jgi:hypothetical protein
MRSYFGDTTLARANCDENFAKFVPNAGRNLKQLRAKGGK